MMDDDNLDIFREVVFAFLERKGMPKNILDGWSVDYGEKLDEDLSYNLSRIIYWLNAAFVSIKNGDRVAERAALIQCYAYSQMLFALFEAIKDDLDKMAFGDFGLPDVPEGYKHPDA